MVRLGLALEKLLHDDGWNIYDSDDLMDRIGHAALLFSAPLPEMAVGIEW